MKKFGHIENSLIMQFFLLGLLLTGCDKKDQEGMPKLSFERPENFPEATYTFDNNNVSLEKFELGKRLFFDPIMSRDGSVSCGSCHVQSVAFSDPQHRLSIGIGDQIGKRNAPPIMNLAFMNNFFWDGGVTHVDFISINPIENPIEMDEDIGHVVSKLNNNSSYVRAFNDAFGTDTITTPFLLQALSQYMLQLVSADSPYDRYARDEDKDALSNEELVGLQVFEMKCASCHQGALFTDQSFRNNGLDSAFDRDAGRAVITELAQDAGKFRVPSLRNIALTSPYMHDGRFQTLAQVLEHYDQGVKISSTLDSTFIDGDAGRLGIAISDEEKESLIAFLTTLTDEKFVQNPLFRKN